MTNVVSIHSACFNVFQWMSMFFSIYFNLLHFLTLHCTGSLSYLPSPVAQINRSWSSSTMQNLLRRCTACFFPRRYWCGPTADRHIGTHTHSIQMYTHSYTLHTHWYTPGLICLVVRLAAGELDIGGEINQRQQLPLTHNARPQAGVYIPTTASNRGVYHDNGLKRRFIFCQCQQAGAHILIMASKGGFHSDNARLQAGV